MELIDTHAHIADKEFSEDLTDVIARAKLAGVSNIICVASGEELQSNYNVINIINRFDNVFGTIGLHPLYAKNQLNEELLLELSQKDKIVAIGETGLDYYYTPDTKTTQKEWLRAHIRIAKKVKKPLIIHARSAGNDCLEILKEEKAEEIGGVFHCYAEDYEFAKKTT